MKFSQQWPTLGRRTAILTASIVLVLKFVLFDLGYPATSLPQSVLSHRQHILDRCNYIKTPAGPPDDFSERIVSDRFVEETEATLIRNAKVWTGGRNGTEVIFGDVLLDSGIIQAVGYIPQNVLERIERRGLHIIDANNAWITPGLIDLHSHIGVSSAPHLAGAGDTNSRKSPILPWLRSIDGLNTHDASYELALAGGVTTAQILPGSANNIGGQAFAIKLRPTKERSPTAMVLEPPHSLNGSDLDYALRPRWRHMKHACGENPSRVYSQTRMDSAWAFRSAYDSARKIKIAQDAFCSAAEEGRWNDLETRGEPAPFPDDLQWEALVDVLRGKVKVSTHCYEAVDLDGIVRLSNEFRFPIASFHHAGETYLVPDLLKKTWGGAPAIALFASNFRKKREAYRGSEFAPRILAKHGIPVVMKSDHPVVNSRYLLHEAAQAHYYGLHPSLALSSITRIPAAAAGMDHRIGYVKKGYDADIVIWDSHPLTLGATPTHVFVDGISQLPVPFIASHKSAEFQEVPKVPNFDIEATEAVKYEGLPPLEPRHRNAVVFLNVSQVFGFPGRLGGEGHSVYVRNGEINCVGYGLECLQEGQSLDRSDDGIEIIDLEGGELAPGLTSFGAPLGLLEIRLEPSTNDGSVYDVFSSNYPTILGNNTIIRAVDGLAFGGRNTLLAYRAGVTQAVSYPLGNSLLLGLSTAFSPGAAHGQAPGAIFFSSGSLHLQISHALRASVSTQIAVLRRFLHAVEFNTYNKELNADNVFREVVRGERTLVIHVEDADSIATLITLKAEVEAASGYSMEWTFTGASEAHLLAREIAAASISVIVIPSRPFPSSWEQRRILPGPPLTNDSAIVALLEQGVNVAVGVEDEYNARNTRFEIAWAALESQGRIDQHTAIALATTNLEKALGIYRLRNELGRDLVAVRGGGILGFGSKVVGVISPQRQVIDLF